MRQSQPKNDGQKSKDRPSSDTESDALARAEAQLQPTNKTAAADHQASTADTTGADGGQPSPAPAPSSDSLIFGSMLVDLSDKIFVRWAGDGSAMQGDMRAQAVEAWGRVIDRYLPSLLQSGPLGQLGLIYSAHLTACYYSRTCQTTVPLPDSSANVGAEKPPC